MKEDWAWLEGAVGHGASMERQIEVRRLCISALYQDKKEPSTNNPRASNNVEILCFFLKKKMTRAIFFAELSFPDYVFLTLILK